MHQASFVFAVLVIAFAGAAPVAAAERTMITDFTGLDCMTNNEAPFYALANDEDGPQGAIPNETELHIFRGKQFGPYKAFPETQAEFDRVWFQVARVQGSGKPARDRVWVQSSFINCGG